MDVDTNGHETDIKIQGKGSREREIIQLFCEQIIEILEDRNIVYFNRVTPKKTKKKNRIISRYIQILKTGKVIRISNHYPLRTNENTFYLNITHDFSLKCFDEILKMLEKIQQKNNISIINFNGL